MQDSKEITWASDYSAEAADEPKANGRASGVHADDKADSDGWQQYRRWISKAPAPRSRRAGVDSSLYTWKGYRNWAEQVKRNWSDS